MCALARLLKHISRLTFPPATTNTTVHTALNRASRLGCQQAAWQEIADDAVVSWKLKGDLGIDEETMRE